VTVAREVMKENEQNNVKTYNISIEVTAVLL
jgi:hypothetical protein